MFDGAREVDMVINVGGAVSDDALLEAMAENPILIERPIVEPQLADHVAAGLVVPRRECHLPTVG